MLVNTQNFSAIDDLVRHCRVLHFPPLSFWSVCVRSYIVHPLRFWSVIVRSCNVRSQVFRGLSLSGLAFSVDPIYFTS